MSYGVQQLFSSQIYSFGNMNEASSSTTFPQELADITEDDKLTFHHKDLRGEPEIYNYYKQVDHRAVGVPLQCPLMIDYQPAGVNNNHSPIIQQPFTPIMKVSDWRCQQVTDNPKKRLNNVCGQNVVNKKLARPDRMQGMRERVPMRRSQKLADKITALQKLVSPYGKTDTASVLQEAHITISLLHGQIKKLLQSTQISRINDGSLQLQDNEEAETSLRDKGLCLVPVSSPQISSLDYFVPGNY